MFYVYQPTQKSVIWRTERLIDRAVVLIADYSVGIVELSNYTKGVN